MEKNKNSGAYHMAKKRTHLYVFRSCKQTNACNLEGKKKKRVDFKMEETSD